VVIGVGSGVLPFRALRRLLTQAVDARVSPWGTNEIPAERAAQAVKVASRYTPGFSICLTQALDTQVLLARRVHPAILRVGVAEGGGDEFGVNAWVENEYQAVWGDTISTW
jgi:hypothetical protein